MTRVIHFSLLLSFCSCLLLLAGCSGIKTEAKYPTGDRRGNETNDIHTKGTGLFGDGEGLKLLSRDKKEEDNGIGVNGFLWRASIDTISFMPLSSADPFGGVIITDWYSPEGTKNERFKLNVFITERQLKADGIQVKVFKQALKRGTWVDSAASDEMGRELEDTILTRARQLRVAQLGSEE